VDPPVPGGALRQRLVHLRLRFKPWRGASIAAGEEILAYLDEVIDEDDLGQYIRYRHRVTAASWSTGDRRWTVEVTRGDTGQQLRLGVHRAWDKGRLR
jgi:cation diffusion facilitator CzcD-associated flavoprotein CzcO